MLSFEILGKDLPFPTIVHSQWEGREPPLRFFVEFARDEGRLIQQLKPTLSSHSFTLGLKKEVVWRVSCWQGKVEILIRKVQVHFIRCGV
jgi:hypothetical protein